MQGLPERVFAPQRGLDNIGPVLADGHRSFAALRFSGTGEGAPRQQNFGGVRIGAARALLGSSQGKLARIAGIGLTTLQRIEQNKGVVKGNFSTYLKIQQALEKAGILFTDNDAGKIGVRLQTSKR
jgi:DNA-binding XRE family transcriptional regulator